MNFLFILLMTFTSLAFGQGSVHVMRDPVPETSPIDPAAPSQAEYDSVAPGSSESNETFQEIPAGEDEEMLQELEAQRTERAKKFEQIEAADPGGDGENFDPMAELKKLGHEKITIETLLDEKAIPVFSRVFKESKLRDLPREEVRALVMGKFAGQPLEKLFQKCPKCLDIFVDVIRDEKAMPSLLEIFLRKQDLKKFGFIWLGVLIALFFLKRKIFPKSWPFYKRVPASILTSLCFTLISFIVFYSMFRSEAEPTVKIVLNHI